MPSKHGIKKTEIFLTDFTITNGELLHHDGGYGYGSFSDPGRGLLDVLSPESSLRYQISTEKPILQSGYQPTFGRDVFGIQSIQKRQRIEHVFLFNIFFWM